MYKIWKFLTKLGCDQNRTGNKLKIKVNDKNFREKN